MPDETLLYEAREQEVESLLKTFNAKSRKLTPREINKVVAWELAVGEYAFLDPAKNTPAVKRIVLQKFSEQFGKLEAADQRFSQFVKKAKSGKTAAAARPKSKSHEAEDFAVAVSVAVDGAINVLDGVTKIALSFMKKKSSGPR